MKNKIIIPILTGLFFSTSLFELGHGLSKGFIYPLAFTNITSGLDETSGFIQLLVGTTGTAKMKILTDEYTLLKPIDRLSTANNLTNFYNSTEDFISNKIIILSGESTIDYHAYGVISDEPIFVIGVKSDKGISDAFLVLPMVTSSTEFFIALWPENIISKSSISVIAALDDTCIEIYKIFNGDKYVLAYAASLQQLQVLRFYQNGILQENGTKTDGYTDFTGYYVNATSAIQVIAGNACGFVPDGIPFCDYQAEQITPVSQLGQTHVVPPISGRNPGSGYIVRVVATQAGTTLVAWNDKTKNLLRGEYVEIDTTDAASALLMQCDKPCLVMQYNKGYATLPDDTFTDPFMMSITASDRFTSSAAFGTANYCDDDKKYQLFDNYVSLVTFSAFESLLQFDGTQMQNVLGFKGWKRNIAGYSFTSFSISHGFHLIDVLPGSAASFAAYVYGHSVMSTSDSAYGFAANINITGNFISEVWKKNEVQVDQELKSKAVCTEDLMSYGFNDNVSFPFELTTKFGPVSMSDNCAANYETELLNGLKQISKRINDWICHSQNCSYLTSYSVAIDYSNLNISFLKNANGQYTGFKVYVVVVAIPSTLSLHFANCRIEIYQYLQLADHWTNLHGPACAVPSLFPFTNLIKSKVQTCAPLY